MCAHRKVDAYMFINSYNFIISYSQIFYNIGSDILFFMFSM